LNALFVLNSTETTTSYFSPKRYKTTSGHDYHKVSDKCVPVPVYNMYCQFSVLLYYQKLK